MDKPFPVKIWQREKDRFVIEVFVTDYPRLLEISL
jgi:hypothetical protein